MKLKLFTIPCTLIAVISMLFTACSKEGPVGPAGPAGAQGPAGPAGPQGDTGVANVIYSDWLDVAFTPDTTHNGNIIDTVGYTAQIAAPKLTNEILSKGEVKVYLNIGTTDVPTIVPLPLDAALFQTIITPIFEQGMITLIAADDVSTTTNTSNQKTLQYRYILIPGGATASNQGVTGSMDKVDWNNYNSVKTYLDLKN